MMSWKGLHKESLAIGKQLLNVQVTESVILSQTFLFWQQHRVVGVLNQVTITFS